MEFQKRRHIWINVSMKKEKYQMIAPHGRGKTGILTSMLHIGKCAQGKEISLSNHAPYGRYEAGSFSK